jgi:hypothetical protein
MRFGAPDAFRQASPNPIVSPRDLSMNEGPVLWTSFKPPSVAFVGGA